MESSPDEQTLDSRFLVFGLLVKCPFYERRKDSCALSGLAQSLSLEEKYEYSMKLEKEEVDAVIKTHKECFKSSLPSWS